MRKMFLSIRKNHKLELYKSNRTSFILQFSPLTGEGWADSKQSSAKLWGCLAMESGGLFFDFNNK